LKFRDRLPYFLADFLAGAFLTFDFLVIAVLPELPSIRKFAMGMPHFFKTAIHSG
jgi:hypothetical protein